MTIKEINQLVRDEDNKVLRNPIEVDEYTKAELYMQKRIMDGVNYLLTQEKTPWIIKRMAQKQVVKSLSGVIDLKGKGLYKDPYFIKTRFGSGSFYRANEIFKDRKTPKDIKRNFCYSNAQLFALTTDIDCKVVSGIAYLDKPFLHSVVSVGKKIIDFNFNVVMDADLFYKLTKFEILAEIDSKTLKSSIEIYEQKKSLFKDSKIQTVTMVFAFEDFLDWLNNEERQQNEYIGLGN